MSTILDFDLKRCFHILTQEDRWNVLGVYMLHANIRNRCWPSMDTVTRMATNGNRGHATRAKKWLIEHGAIEIVPGGKRVGDEEKKLPPRQHIYQLTGILKIDGQTYRYLYHSTQADVEPKRSDGQTFKRSTIESFDGESFDGETGSISSDSLSNESDIPTSDDMGSDDPPKDPPKKARKRKPDVVFDTIADCAYGITDTTNVSNGSTIGAIKRIAVKQFTLEYGNATPEIIAQSIRMFAGSRRGFPQYQTTFEAPYVAYLQSHRPAIQALLNGTSPSKNGKSNGSHTAGLDDVTGGAT
jgi:hypothetical protein